MQYDLRKLLIAAAVCPPTAAAAWFAAPYVFGTFFWTLAWLTGCCCG